MNFLKYLTAMSLDLNKLANKLDEALSNETSESLNEWLGNKRMSNTIGITWDEYGNPIPLTGETNNTPATIDMWALRQGITMYLDDLDSYGTDAEVNTATDVLWDFVKYVEAMGVSVAW